MAVPLIFRVELELEGVPGSVPEGSTGQGGVDERDEIALELVLTVEHCGTSDGLVKGEGANKVKSARVARQGPLGCLVSQCERVEQLNLLRWGIR